MSFENAAGSPRLEEPAHDMETPFPTQHSRTGSVQSTSTDYDATTTATDTKESRFPELVRRDMEFFMARLTRTNSADSTGSTGSR
ncbi:hypothetical protein N658DRAFT_497468 [Parathielavia hyrcaniae]|uniref:Uncharacterized protein n=1 Tax=Parathielavia hyrcaniae TaxID=113614 RepID=A0AAN6PYE4_9PEZI|nr:hypothetical protein N658DRAFT_497468 [Parathielavia hyrcaniae]